MKALRLPCYLAVMVLWFATIAQAQEQQSNEGSTNPSDKEWVDFKKEYRIPSPEEITTMKAEDAKEELQKSTAQQSQALGNALADFKRGAGLGITVAPDAGERVDEAFVVDDKIVVTKENINAARMMFEFHQLFTTNVFTTDGRRRARAQIEACERNPLDCPMFGVGPFLALQMSDDTAVASVGVGLLLGVRNDPRKDTSFNIGVGVQWDSKVKKLAKGFVPGQALPKGEEEIRFIEKGEARLMFGISLGF